MNFGECLLPFISKSYLPIPYVKALILLYSHKLGGGCSFP